MAEQQLYIHGGYTSATSGRTSRPLTRPTVTCWRPCRPPGVGCRSRREECPTGAKNLGGDAAMERSRILRRAVDILRERNTNSQNWKPSTPEKRIRKPQPRYRYRRGRARVLRRADPVAEGSQIPLRETSFVYTRREPLA